MRVEKHYKSSPKSGTQCFIIDFYQHERERL